MKVAATHGGISTGGDGASHQACEDIAITRALPHMTVLVPGDYEEARRATFAAAHINGPVYLRFGRDTYPVVPELHGEFVIGRAKLLRKGADVALVSTGIMVHEALQAANIVRQALSLLSIKEVASRVGYVRQHDFNRMFHRHFDTAPSHWRKNPAPSSTTTS